MSEKKECENYTVDYQSVKRIGGRLPIAPVYKHSEEEASEGVDKQPVNLEVS